MDYCVVLVLYCNTILLSNNITVYHTVIPYMPVDVSVLFRAE